MSKNEMKNIFCNWILIIKLYRFKKIEVSPPSNTGNDSFVEDV
jgi:hypothetical protein